MFMSPKVILLASVFLNAGLVIAYVLTPKAPTSGTAEGKVEAASVIARKEAMAVKGTRTEVVTNRLETAFHWREVEAEDYREYIAKLRGIGCPEATIRDIIIADIDKLYEPRMVALREQPNYQPDKFWINENYGYGRKRDPEKAAQLKALTEERAALIKELLGVEERELRQAYSSYDDNSQTQLAFLSSEQRDKVKELDRKFSDERNKIYAEAGGYIDMETQKELATVRKKMLEEMKGFMTPEQIFEYDIRTSDTARNLKYQLRGVEPTEAEFRALFAARQVEEDSRVYGEERAKMTPEQIKENQEAQKLAQDNLKAALGDERYKEMQMAREYGYQQLVNAAPFLGFDKSAAQRVMSVKTDSEKAANDVRRNQSLTPEQRTKALQDIRMAAEAAVTKEIGEKGYKYYRQQGGYWFNNIAPRPTPAVTR
ncbi:MAG: hypothetical protein ACO1QS_06220 [Verrucomicrobiota bacterium]